MTFTLLFNEAVNFKSISSKTVIFDSLTAVFNVACNEVNLMPLTSATPPSETPSLLLATFLISSSDFTSLTFLVVPFTVTVTFSSLFEYAPTLEPLSSVTVTELLAIFKLTIFAELSTTKYPLAIRAYAEATNS